MQLFTSNYLNFSKHKIHPFFAINFLGFLYNFETIFSPKNCYNICEALHDLVPFAQFIKREKTPMNEYYFK